MTSLWWEGPERPITMLLHMHGPRQFHRACNGTNQFSGCKVTASERIWVTMGMSGMPEQANDHAVAYLWVNIVPYNLSWSESVQYLWNYSVCNSSEWTDGQTDGHVWNVGQKDRQKDGCKNWPHFCNRSSGWTCHHPRVGSPVAPRAATPWVRGGASNHGS